MPWSITITNADDREDLKTRLETAPGVEHMPVQVQQLCRDAIDLIPSFGEGEAPATGYNLNTSGHVNSEGVQSTSNFTISVSNNFVTNG